MMQHEFPHVRPQTFRTVAVRSLAAALLLALAPALLRRRLSVETCVRTFRIHRMRPGPWSAGGGSDRRRKPEILRELQQMKADGIQGAELAFVYPEVLDDPAKT